jgi:hypothetical protein
MANDDDDEWLDKIHKDRKAAKENAESAAQDQRRREEAFHTKADDFWNTIAQELERLVARYNEKAEEGLRVQSERGLSQTFSVEWPNRMVRQVSMDKPGRLIQVVDRSARHDAGEATRDWEKMHTNSVEVTPSGDLTVEGWTPNQFARAVLQAFFSRIG